MGEAGLESEDPSGQVGWEEVQREILWPDGHGLWNQPGLDLDLRKVTRVAIWKLS